MLLSSSCRMMERRGRHLEEDGEGGGLEVCISRMWNWLSAHRCGRAGDDSAVSAFAIHTRRSSRSSSGPPGEPELAAASTSSSSLHSRLAASRRPCNKFLTDFLAL